MHAIVLCTEWCQYCLGLLFQYNFIVLHLQYEKTRKRNPNLVSDVFDCKAWKLRLEQIGAGPDDVVIMLLFCMDAIPAFKNQGLSLMPAESIVLNVAPWLRGKPEYMMLHFLIPATLKEHEQKKYFDYMTIELNTLATTGIPHPSGRGVIKVAVFATPLDLPGRDKFFWLRGSFSTLYTLFINSYIAVHARTQDLILCKDAPFA